MTGFLRSNWYLFVLFFGVTVALTLQVTQAAEPEPTAEPGRQAVLAKHYGNGAPSSRQRSSPQDEARETISRYEERFAADPGGEDAPSYLMAMGNLSRQKLLDYEAAAHYYALLVERFPDWERIDKVYPNLVTCYQQLGDQEALRRTYLAMQDRYPESSPYHEFATAGLFGD
jgi:TolA-binding protein